MVNDFIIREYKDNDVPQILNLMNRNFINQQHLNINRDLYWWEWKYNENIFGKPIIKVMEHDNKIIACRPFWPWKLNLRGHELKCYQPVDAVVDKEYRGKGVFSRLTTETILENKNKIDLIFNFSNNQSIGANVRLGWTHVGSLEWFVKINNLYSSYKQVRNSTGFEPVNLKNIDMITLEKIDCIKENIDFSGKLKTLRTKEFLKWRYLQHPYIKYGMKTINIKRKSLHFIYEINENNFGRELIIVDYFGDIDLFEYMLLDINSISKEYKVAFISLINKYNTPRKFLYKNLYIKQKRKNLLVLPFKLGVEQVAISYENWDMFLGMHDSI